MTDTTTTTAAPAAAPAPVASSAAAALAGSPPAAAAPAPAADPAAAAPAPAPAGVTVPGNDATPEQWSEFYGKLGRPEKSAEYELTVRDGEDPAFVGEVADTMHQYGLTKAQALGLQKDLSAKAEARMAAAEQQRVAALDAKNTAEQTELKSALGDKFEPQMELARRAAKQFGGEHAGDIITAMEDRIGYKATMQYFMSIGAGLGEHDAGSQAQAAGAAETKTAAQVLYPSHFPK